MRTPKHQVLVVGGGTAGISVAARLRRRGVRDIAVIEPSPTHYYQPLWTLVGAGCAEIADTARPQSRVTPRGVHWIRHAVTAVDPGARNVTLNDGSQVGYDVLVMAPGIQLDWNRIEGAPAALETPGVSSNYEFDRAPKTWDAIRELRGGTAVFTMPSGPIKCAGAPQKIAYLACDHWRREGVLDDIDVHLVLPTPGLFGVPVFAAELERVVADYGIIVHTESEVVSVDAANRTVAIVGLGARAGQHATLGYDLLHLTPPQSAPDWVKESPLADRHDPGGYIEVDKHTLQHLRHPEVFALGDAGATPNSKTGAAIRKQAPVVAANVAAVLSAAPPTARYDGYASCPLTTSRSRVLLAEFDYTMQPHPTLPFIDTTTARRDMWLLKKYGLPPFYWHLMLKGLA